MSILGVPVVEVLQLMLGIKRSQGILYIFIMHDQAVTSYMRDRMAVMYLGEKLRRVEKLRKLLTTLHPCTRALMEAMPEPNPSNRLLLRKVSIIGEVHSAVNVPLGCRFHPRCPFAMDVCRKKEPHLVEEKGCQVAC
uniref:ABC transporter ATP-binding protein n=1 Tax=Ignisphaera aggregans TaxID=334771 RepID=A0A7J3Z6W3_9CREN